MKLIATEKGLNEIKVGRLIVSIEEIDTNYIKLTKNFELEEVKNTKDYIKLVNNLISNLKYPRSKIERGLRDGYLKLRNYLSHDAMLEAGDAKAEITKDNKTIYKNIEKVESKKVIEHCFVRKKDISINYMRFEYNEVTHKLKNYGKKKLFEIGLSPTIEGWMIDDWIQESFLLSFELNEDFETMFYKTLKREIKKLIKAERKIKYLSELILKEEKEQNQLEMLGYIPNYQEDDLNDGLTD